MSGPHGPWPGMQQPPAPPLIPPQPPPPRRPRPHEVQVAVYLWIAGLVLSLIGLVTSFGSIGAQVREELNSQLAHNPDLASIDADLVVRIASVAVVVVGLAGVAIRVWLIVKFAAGRRWARTVLTVLGALSVAGAVLGVRSAAPFDAGLTVVNALLTAAAIVYMFSEGANPYFAGATGR